MPPFQAEQGMYVLKRVEGPLEPHLRCLKTRFVPCDAKSVDALADRYQQHLKWALGDRGDEIGQALRESFHNYAQHSGRYDPANKMKVTSVRSGSQLLFFLGMETDVVYDPNVKRSGRCRGHGQNIISCLSDGLLVDVQSRESTGTGSIVYFDCSRAA